MMSVLEQLQQEIQHLPEHLAQEVLDFIEYLELKHRIRAPELENLKTAQLNSLEKLWDNPEDEAWNDM